MVQPETQTPAAPASKSTHDECYDDCLALMSSMDLAAALVKKTSEFVNFINASGRLWTWRSMNYQMNSGLYYGGSLGRSGAMGELVNFPVNIFSELVDQVVAQTTQTKVQWTPVATNADFDSEASTEVAKGAMSYYQTDKGVDALHTQQTYDTILFGEGHVFTTWDKGAGDIVTADLETKSLTKAGDVRLRSVTPLQVVRDVYVTDFADNLWFNVIVLENKYELMKKYSDMADKISEIQSERRTGSPAAFLSPNTSKTDMIAVNYFIHKRSLVLPFGRQMIWLDEDTVLEDGHLETDDFPLDSMIVRDTRLTNFGYSKFFDILVLQRMFDVITNAIATNITAFSTINVLVPDGADFSTNDVTGGMNFIKYKPLPGGLGEPKALELLATPPEAYKFLDWIEQRMQKLAGIPDVINGPNFDTGANTPGQPSQALALRATASIQFNTLVQKASVASLQNKGNIILGFLKKFASESRLGLIAGNAAKTYIKAFKKEDLDHVHRVRVTLGNPLAQTPEGRLQLAMLYNTLGLTDAHTVAEVIETGALQALTSGPQQEIMAAKKEIEMLRAGQVPKPLLTQNHMLAIQQIQLNVLNDPQYIMAATTPGSQGATGQDAMIVQNAINCIKQHIQLWKILSAQEPELVAAMRMPNIAPPPPGAPAPGNKAAATPKTSSPQLNEAAHNMPVKP